MQQLERQRLFVNTQTGERSLRFLDLCQDMMRLNRKVDKNWTLFREIGIVPFSETVSIEDRALYDLQAATVEERPEWFYDRFLVALERVIEQEWSPDKCHLVLHSSGYDSRLISGTIRNIYKRRGDDWLGKVLFTCYGPECDTFLDIMEYEGWTDTQVMALPHVEEMLATCLTQSHGAHASNGPVQAPLNTLYTIPFVLHDAGLIPNDVQMWMGWGTDYAMKGAGDAKGNRLAAMQKDSYQQPTSIACGWVDDMAYPFQAHDVLKVCIESTIRNAFYLRREILAYLDNGLAAFSRMEMPGGDPVNAWLRPGWVLPLVPLSAYERTLKEYGLSWYGRKVVSNPQPTRDTSYHQWWQHWSAAAICQHLRETGTVIQ